MREARLLDKRERRTSARTAETEDQGTSRRSYQVELYAKRVKSRITLNFARSQIASNVPESIIDEHSGGDMTFSCSLCLAKFWEGEKLSGSTKLCCKFSLCCGDGKVVLPPVASHPELLMHLLTATDPRSRAFRAQIRAYNSALAFASLGVNLDKSLANAKQGVYTFRIHGVVH